jgi:cytochrome c-type biogenesis protein CcmF
VLSAFLAIGPIARWKRSPFDLFKRAAVLLGVSAVLGVALPLILTGALDIAVTVAIALSLWIIATHLMDFVGRRGARPLGYVGMVVAHIGFAVSIMGVAVTSVFSHAVDSSHPRPKISRPNSSTIMRSA